MKVGVTSAFSRNTRFGSRILISLFAAFTMATNTSASGVTAPRARPAPDARPPQSNGNVPQGTRPSSRAIDERFGGSEPASKGASSLAAPSLPSPEPTLVKPKARKHREDCRNQRRAVDRFDPKQAPVADACTDFPNR
jgi:hypothetical protein